MNSMYSILNVQSEPNKTCKLKKKKLRWGEREGGFKCLTIKLPHSIHVSLIVQNDTICQNTYIQNLNHIPFLWYKNDRKNLI